MAHIYCTKRIGGPLWSEVQASREELGEITVMVDHIGGTFARFLRTEVGYNKKITAEILQKLAKGWAEKC